MLAPLLDMVLEEEDAVDEDDIDGDDETEEEDVDEIPPVEDEDINVAAPVDDEEDDDGRILLVQLSCGTGKAALTKNGSESNLS